jgi:hypothetical protein
MYLIWHTKIMGRTEARSVGKNWDEVEEDRVGSQDALSAGKLWRGASCAVDLPNPFLFAGQPCGSLKILS